ncbi:MAG: hypothetical protein N3A65_06110 [candidate division WOR-3 bacterium]|nr:hypothetical protein [candidate division WOR-3 bacterium]
MDENILNVIEDRGLGLPFIVKKDGTTLTSRTGENMKQKFAQTATVVFETISALGNVKIENLEIIGNNQSILCDISEDDLIGHIYATAQTPILENIYNAVKEIRARHEAIALEEEKPKEKYPPDFLDQLKAIVQEYLGDFTERIFQNQLKAQRIKVDSLYEEDIRRFIFALGKAAGMIVGPTKGKDLTNKLLAKLK